MEGEKGAEKFIHMQRNVPKDPPTHTHAHTCTHTHTSIHTFTNITHTHTSHTHTHHTHISCVVGEGEVSL